MAIRFNFVRKAKCFKIKILGQVEFNKDNFVNL